MANESRPRAAHFPKSPPTTKDNISPTALPHGTFQYTPLDRSIESFRVLVIHPKSSTGDDGIIKCSLEHTSFGERPSYEALSYRWGDPSTFCHTSILVNGDSFTVGKNLGSALARLQVMTDRTIWIDAICINQKDLAEKSRQLPLMPFIYERCRKCVAWLGEVHPKVDISRSSILQRPPWNIKSGHETARGELALSQNADADATLLKRLANNTYWKRVWIIQEICLAKRIEMLYGIYQASFSAFTSQLELVEGLEDCIPLRLQKQLDDKYFESHSLQYLIESHASSICQEPRDHIYGFVGLSSDGQRFPIDYSKSHYEVWKDAVLFKIAQSNTPQNDTLSFATLVKEKLGGTTMSKHEIAEDELLYQAAVTDQLKVIGRTTITNTKLLKLPGQIMMPSQSVGIIGHIGPTCEEVIAFPRTTLDWRASINELVESDRRPLVREQSDLLLEKLQTLKQEMLDMIELYRDVIAWKSHQTHSGPGGFGQQEEDQERDLFLEDSKDSPGDSDDDLQSPKTPRLFLLDQVGKHSKKNLGYVGIVPTGARVGDHLYQIHGVTRAVVVRKGKSTCCIVGTAFITTDLSRARTLRHTDDTPFAKADFNTNQKEKDKLDLYLDIAKLYRLLD